MNLDELRKTLSSEATERCKAQEKTIKNCISKSMNNKRRLTTGKNMLQHLVTDVWCLPKD